MKASFLRESSTVKRVVSKSLRPLFVWLMVPLAVLAGRPTAACVCASGQLQTVCLRGDWLFRGLTAAMTLDRDTPRNAHGPVCASCVKVHANRASQPGAPGCRAAHQCECHSVANSATIAVRLSHSAALPLTTEGPPVAYATCPPTVPQPIAAVLDIDPGPPRDRVVALLHLTL